MMIKKIPQKSLRDFLFELHLYILEA